MENLKTIEGRIEKIPENHKYYLGVVRSRPGEPWMSTTCFGKDLRKVKRNLADYWEDWEEKLIVSFDLPNI